MLAVARPPSPEMLEADPSLARLRFWGELLRFPVFASLGVFAVGIVLTIVLNLTWLYLVIGGALGWFVFARLAVKVWRDFHLADLDWRLEHGSQRERTLLALAQRAVWNWPDEVPDDATHAVLTIDEVGGELQVERFCGLAEAEERAAQRIDALSGEREAIAVGVVELDAPEERALIEVVNGRLAGRRDLKSLEPAEDGWLVGI